MPQTVLLDPVRILIGSGQEVINDGAALLINGQLIALGEDARCQGAKDGVPAHNAADQLLAPCLVDPHSILEEPFSQHNENLTSLRHAAARSGYGQVALLPQAKVWRDSVERLHAIGCNTNDDVRIHLWGALTLDGAGEHLSCHGDLLEQGAIGLCDGEAMAAPGLLQRSLVLHEMGTAPVLVAPRDPQLQGDGLVREGVETLRAGWPMDPVASETLPLGQLLELQRLFPQARLVAMNVSTSEGVALLQQAAVRPQSSVHWWHLVTDRSQLSPTAQGWCVRPSLGGPNDRNALIDALDKGVITAVGVHAMPLDQEDCLLPPGQRRTGLVGHQLVLPMLWQLLIQERTWSIPQLWQALSFGPSRLLQQPEERLEIGSNRWLLFNPNQRWQASGDHPDAARGANNPLLGQWLHGAVVACGLRSPMHRDDSTARSAK
ncbi:MAG: dihydroorotase [Synechococcus sp.]